LGGVVRDMSRTANIPLAGQSDRGSEDAWEADHHASQGSYSEAIARSMEMSSLLLGRSPWMAQIAAPGLVAREAHEAARSRSLSMASAFRPDGSDGSHQSVRLEEGDAGDAFLRPKSTSKSHRASHDKGDSNKDYDPVTGEELPDLDEEGYDGQAPLSGFWQSVFNSTNLLMGVGLLSLPYACRLAGWMGVPILLLLAGMTNYTAKIIGEIMDYQPSQKLRDGPGAYAIMGFADMGSVAFGDVGKYFMFTIFFIETAGYACVYIIIEAENLKSQLMSWDAFSSFQQTDWLLLSTVVFLPPMWLPNLSVLSYMSAFGVLSSLTLLFGVVLEGAIGVAPNKQYCVEPHCTGSWIHPSPTTPYIFSDLPIVIGLVMVGFAGHAVFPTIRNDMMNKAHYNSMVDVTYCMVLSAYLGICVAGYMMFGSFAEEQITLNLGKGVISHIIIWMVISNPICKYPLDMAPITFGLEAFFQIAFKIPYNSWLFTFVSLTIRTTLVFLSLAAVVAVPSFAVMVSLLGSLGSFTICVTFPCACYLKLFWTELSLPIKCMNIVFVICGAAGSIVGVYQTVAGGAAENLGSVEIFPAFREMMSSAVSYAVGAAHV